MITEQNFRTLLQQFGFEENNQIFEKHFSKTEAYLKVDFGKKELIYPENKGLIINERQTCNFAQAENFVVFECVHRLLEKGYDPKHLELEPKWKLGREGKGGRADILVKNQENKPLLLIECKTAGNEFAKAWKETQQDGGQLFSYAQQISETQFLCLYASDFSNEKLRVEHYMITIKDIQNEVEKDANKEIKRLFYKDATNVEQRFLVWKETYHYDFQTKGIFENDIQAYNIGKEKITIKDLRYISSNELKTKFHEFATLLREHNVSSKESAFDKLISLFLCKIVDETESQHNEKALDFYWRGEYADNYFNLIDRLQRLYKEGMQEYLGETITYIDNQKVIEGFSFYNDRNATRDYILGLFKQQKYFTNSDFGFIEVHNQKLFYQNAKILLDVIKMWQDFQLNGEQQNQFLSDMFEVFLDKGFKQSEGQFFTPIPICKFIINALPLEKIIKTYEKPPKVLDYACGSGHFLTEYATQARYIIQQINQEIEQKEYVEDQAKPLQTDLKKYYKNVFGVEKEYRLSKVAKISAFMYGQDEINIIYCDALNAIQQEIKQKIIQVPEESIDILVANPPFAVEGFLKNISKEQKETYSLYKDQDINQNTNNIQCFFLERAKQLLVKGGVAGIIVPTSILSNSDTMHIQTREILLKYFDFVSIVELGSGTFGKTGTNTVVLFLRRKIQNPEQAEHFWNRTQDFFENAEDEIRSNGGMYQDLPVLKKYCEHIDIPFEDYQMILNLQGFENLAGLWNYDIFKEYKTAFEKSTEAVNWQKKPNFKKLSASEQQAELDKMLLDFIRKVEQQKLYYFMLAYHNPQKVLLVRSPADGKEQKQFLGYEWSGAKNSEGIRYNGGETVYDIQTPLFDPNNRNNAEKISYWIAQNFVENKDQNLVRFSETLQGLVSYAHLTDLLDFSRKDFNKAFSLTPKKTVAIESKWEMVKLENVMHIARGASPRPIDKYLTTDADGVNWIKIGDVSEGSKYVTQTAEKITKAGAELSRFVKEGDFILSNSMSFGRPYILKISGCVHDGWLLLSNFSEKLNKDYLYEILSYKDTQEQFIASAAGGVVQNLNSERVRATKIPLPPLPIQEKIVSECEAIDQATENAKIAVEKAKREIEGKVKSWFESGFEMKKMENVFILEYGKGLPEAKRIEGEYPVMGSNGISGYHNEFLTEAPAIIVGRKGSAGKVVYIEKNCYPIDTTFYVKPILLSSMKYFYYVLLSLELEKNRVGIGVPGINRNDIYQIQIPVPPLEIQEQLISKIEMLERRITENELIIRNSAGEKQAVLRKHL